jgi:mitotic spindle assembly checkpoint protein MAD2
MDSACWVWRYTSVLSTIADSNAVSSDEQVKAYIKKIMSQLNKWMVGGKISKLVVVITSKETGEHVERWQFDVKILSKASKHRSSKKAPDKENAAPE